MIFFGHLGITTGAVKAYEKAFNKNNTKIDYRFVLAGSILPDLIDKPLGYFVFKNTIHNSRIFAHTLLFSLILIAIGLVRESSGKSNNIFLLGTGSLIHLILDSMWLFPVILFWPYYGFNFPPRTDNNWIQSALTRLLTDPSYFIPELIGFFILLYYFIRLLHNKQLKDFIKTGRL